jgi:hypothetical protein
LNEKKRAIYLFPQKQRNPIREKQKRHHHKILEPKKQRTTRTGAFEVVKADDVEIVVQTIREVFWSGSRWWWR